MKIGLIDVDGHNFPNLALMKISAYHKAKGDEVSWCIPLLEYDIVYQCKVFSDTYSNDISFLPQADKVIKGGTGYAIEVVDGKEIYHKELDKPLPDEIEHQYPDYHLHENIIPWIRYTSVGFLTRGCCNNCNFCIVSDKEGRCSKKVSDLSEWHHSQSHIKLLDPNLLACTQHLELLQQLENSKAYIDFTQGLDIRLINNENIELINRLKLKNIHFAWDNPKVDLRKNFEFYANRAKHKPHGHFGTVYCLVNFNSTLEEDLYRIYELRDLGFNPYVMIYNKPTAPQQIRYLQRWCNNRLIFESVPKFEDYDHTRG